MAMPDHHRARARDLMRFILDSKAEHDQDCMFNENADEARPSTCIVSRCCIIDSVCPDRKGLILG